MKWTIVQHSGFGYGGNPGFARAVETRGIEKKSEESLVLKAGGLLFDSYLEAVQFEEKANGIDDPSGGLYPRAKGSFSNSEVDGLRIYIPVREVVG